MRWTPPKRINRNKKYYVYLHSSMPKKYLNGSRTAMNIQSYWYDKGYRHFHFLTRKNVKYLYGRKRD
jgi:lipoprotein-anchoring transpeptidase ErfK/SrfK